MSNAQCTFQCVSFCQIAPHGHYRERYAMGMTFNIRIQEYYRRTGDNLKPIDRVPPQHVATQAQRYGRAASSCNALCQTKKYANLMRRRRKR